MLGGLCFFFAHFLFYFILCYYINSEIIVIMNDYTYFFATILLNVLPRCRTSDKVQTMASNLGFSIPPGAVRDYGPRCLGFGARCHRVGWRVPTVGL